jgi:sorting nexin-25
VRMSQIMALQGRDIVLAGIASFIAWGYAVNWIPTLRWAGYAFVTGFLLAVLGLLALILLTSKGPVAFLGPKAWEREVAALRARQTYAKPALYPESPKVSAALDQVLEYIIRDFINVWYSSISKNPAFSNEVDKTLRDALLGVRDRLMSLDLAETLTTRLVPILTAHFRDFYEAERAVRGRKLNRSVTESEELDLAIASKYRDGKLHPAATLSFSDTKMAQQDYLRKVVFKILPKVLPGKLLASRAVATIIREIVACAVLSPVMQIRGISLWRTMAGACCRIDQLSGNFVPLWINMPLRRRRRQGLCRSRGCRLLIARGSLRSLYER